MKNLFSLVLMCLCMTSVTFSQTNKKTDVLTSGKWKVESIQIGEETEKCSENNSWMVFSANGQYKVVMSEGEKLDKLQYCLSNSFAFGGNNFSAVIGKNYE